MIALHIIWVILYLYARIKNVLALYLLSSKYIMCCHTYSEGKWYWDKWERNRSKERERKREWFDASEGMRLLFNYPHMHLNANRHIHWLIFANTRTHWKFIVHKTTQSHIEWENWERVNECIIQTEYWLNVSLLWFCFLFHSLTHWFVAAK